MDQRKRKRLLDKYLGEACNHLGFEPHSTNYFTRMRGPLQDAFFYQQTRTNGQYYITYGIDCPNLLSDLRASAILSLSNHPTLLITPMVDRLENGKSYGCKHEEHIENSSKKVSIALSNEALPWWESHTSEADVIEKYRIKNVGLLEPSDELPPGKVLRWTMYGLLLHDYGNQDQARIWLFRALDAWRNRGKPTSADKEWARIIESRIL